MKKIGMLLLALDNVATLASLREIPRNALGSGAATECGSPTDGMPSGRHGTG